MPRYRNTEPHPLQGLKGFLRWRLGRLTASSRRSGSASRPSLTARSTPRRPPPRPRLTWIGHSTFLIELDQVVILTDPHFSERASPWQRIGPRRLVPPAVALEDLPPIDLVVVSHNHYDHLDRGSLRRLAASGPPRRVAVPPGLGRSVERWCGAPALELAWWESRELDTLTVHAVPVKHSSCRWGPDRNRTGWNGYVLEVDDWRFFFAGDTAYGSDFRSIRERRGPIDVAALPIGAYEPRWFMRHVHATPEEAVQIHLDLEAERSVAMHWGTFVLTDEPIDEPPRRLRRALEERGLGADEFRVLGHGESLAL